jgi:hypothetical protein
MYRPEFLLCSRDLTRLSLEKVGLTAQSRSRTRIVAMLLRAGVRLAVVPCTLAIALLLAFSIGHIPLGMYRRHPQVIGITSDPTSAFPYFLTGDGTSASRSKIAIEPAALPTPHL